MQIILNMEAQDYQGNKYKYGTSQRKGCKQEEICKINLEILSQHML